MQMYTAAALGLLGNVAPLAMNRCLVALPERGYNKYNKHVGAVAASCLGVPLSAMSAFRTAHIYTPCLNEVMRLYLL